MKYKMIPISIGIIVCAVFYWNDASACDVCGSSAGYSSLGILAKYNNLASCNWQMTKFTSNKEHDPVVEDNFQEIEFFFRYKLYKRFSLEYYQPYRINQRSIKDEVQELSGISDPKFLVSYKWIDNKEVKSKYGLTAESSFGVRFPIGEYDPRIHDTGLPENFNLSNGSYGYLFNTRVGFGWENGGLLSSINYTHNALTSSDYRFGSSFSNNNIIYSDMDISDKIKLVPSVGVLLEQINKDRYANEKTVRGTGGIGKYFTGSINFKINKWFIGSTYTLPFQESYSQGEVSANGKISAQISFIF